MNKARIPEVFKVALAAGDRQKPEHRRRADGQTRQPRVDREARAVRRDPIVENDVEHRLLPHQLRRRIERRRRRVRDGAVEAGERAVRRQRDPRRDDPAVAERGIVLVEVEVAGEPDVRRVTQERRRPRDVEVPGAVERKIDVAHRLERRADHDAEVTADRLDEDEDAYAGRDVVREIHARQREQEPRRNGCRDSDVYTLTDQTPTA